MKLRIILLIISNVLFSSFTYSQTQSKFTREQITGDLDYLFETLESGHYNFNANSPKEAFVEEYERIKNSILDSTNFIDSYRILQPFLSKAKMGHCLINYPFSEYGKFLRSGGTLFPINICFYENEVYVRDNFSDDIAIKVGSKILSINNKPIGEILDEFYNFISGEHQYSINSTIEALNFSRVYWFVFGEVESFDITIENNDGNRIQTSVKAINGGSFEGELAKCKPLTRDDREIKFYDNTAYLFPGPFYNPSDEYFSGNSFETNNYYSFLDSSFTLIKNKGTENLIIDLRNNMGGMSTFSNYLLSFIAKKSFGSSSDVFYKTSQITKDGLKEIPDSVLSGDDLELKEALLTAENGKFLDMSSKEEYTPRSDDLHYKGNVYVLINRYTFSQAIAAAALMQDMNMGLLIGENTSNSCTMYASTQQFELPNTKLKVMYPRAFIERKNKNASSDAVEPDISINQNPFSAKDEILEFTLGLIALRKS